LGLRPPLVIHPCGEYLESLKGSFVGYLRNHGRGDSIQNSMRMEGIYKIKVTSLRGLMVLLQSDVVGEILRAAGNHSLWWNAQFKELKPWTLNKVPSRRVVWLKIYGLPIHVWEEESFKLIRAQFGIFMDFDEETVSRKRLDVARIKVFPDKMGWINDQLVIKVVGEVYVLTVVEGGGATAEVKAVDGVEWDVRLEAASREEEVVGIVWGCSQKMMRESLDFLLNNV